MSQFKAFAKLNLFLNVTGRRNDGYHLIESLVAFADIYDVIEICPAESFSLEVTGEFAPYTGSIESNLITMAVDLFCKKAGLKPDFRIRLFKNIPVGAGLGGGSSDAAVILKYLQNISDNPPEHDCLSELSLTLGADLPACLYGKPAFISGIGEKIFPITIPKLFLVLVNPGILIPTAEIYQAGFKSYSEKTSLSASNNIADFVAELSGTRNDLYNNALKFAPELEEVIAEIDKTRNVLLSRMSGSGATCFGIYADEVSAQAACNKIKKSYPLWWVKSGSTL